jgi:SAM-dependent methyltransferase
MPRNRRYLYESDDFWGKQLHETVLQRARLTVQAVPSQVRTVLDVGSGDGLITRFLQQEGYNPIAFDISHQALKHIRNFRRVQGDVCQMPFPADSFDLVLACELLEHLPSDIFSDALHELSRISRKHIIVTVPYDECLELSHACCPSCGCIFNGAYHVRSFKDHDLMTLLKGFKCTCLKGIVTVLHPDRTTRVELFIRHRLARDYLYYAAGVRCPLCYCNVDKKPKRNVAGWLAAGIRYLYRLCSRKETPLWYLAVYKKHLKD